MHICVGNEGDCWLQCLWWSSNQRSSFEAWQVDCNWISSLFIHTRHNNSLKVTNAVSLFAYQPVMFIKSDRYHPHTYLTCNWWSFFCFCDTTTHTLAFLLHRHHFDMGDYRATCTENKQTNKRRSTLHNATTFMFISSIVYKVWFFFLNQGMTLWSHCIA